MAYFEAVWSYLANIRFTEPDYLWWAAVFLAILCLQIFWIVLRRFIRPKLTFGSRYALVGKFKFMPFVAMFAVLVAVAGARPISLKPGLEIVKGPVDVVFLVDDSISFYVDDIKPSRMDVVKRDIDQLFLGGAFGNSDRLAFYSFSALTRLKMYLSNDDEHRLFKSAVANTNLSSRELENNLIFSSELVGSLEQLYYSLEAFDEYTQEENERILSFENPRIVFIFSDGDFGEYDREKLDEILRKYASRDIKIFCIGVGTTRGASIFTAFRGFRAGTDYDPESYQELFATRTSLEGESLRRISSFFGSGNYISIQRESDSSVEFVTSIIVGSRHSRIDLMSKDGHEELWRMVLFGAFGVLILGLVVRLIF